jgi:hypothetical protein
MSQRPTTMDALYRRRVMAMNRVQYQAGLPMLEFFEKYGTQEQCEELVRAWRWPQGFACPRCEPSSARR